MRSGGAAGSEHASGCGQEPAGPQEEHEPAPRGGAAGAGGRGAALRDAGAGPGAQRHGGPPGRAAAAAPAPGQAAAEALPAAAAARRGVRGALDSLSGTDGVGPGRREPPEPE